MIKTVRVSSGRKILLATAIAMASNSVFADSANTKWIPWLNVAQDVIDIAAPPDSDDSTDKVALIQRLSSLDADAKHNVHHWQTGNPNYRWMQMALERYAKGPPSAIKGRALALLNVAIYDAVAIASNAKDLFKRARPAGMKAILATPDTFSYPSSHAAAAAAAAGVLSYLFPDESAKFTAQAQLAADARVDGGVNFPSDVTTGLAIGEQVAANVVAYAATDKSDTKWMGKRPTGADKLKGDIFINAAVGDWKPWIIESAEKFVPPPPPSIDSPELKAQIDELQAIKRNVPNSIRGWMNHSTWRAYHWWYERLATAVFEKGGTTALPQVALAYASVSTANQDAIIACFKAKYTYWFIRPAQLDPTLPALFPNPPHPSYPAAHSCSSMSYAVSIGHFFPDHAEDVLAAATEAGYSRQIAGIHYPMDQTSGEKLGRDVANEVLTYAQSLVSQ